MEIEEEGVSRPRRITPTEISIILHMIRKPNSITSFVALFHNHVKFFSARTKSSVGSLWKDKIQNGGFAVKKIYPKQFCVCHAFSLQLLRSTVHYDSGKKKNSIILTRLPSAPHARRIWSVSFLLVVT